MSGVDFATAAAEAAGELGALDFVEADESSLADSDVEQTEENQPDQDGTEGEESSVFAELDNENTNSDESGFVEVPGVGQVSIQDLVKGYMKDEDYTQKTQTLADDRRENADAVKLWDALKEDPYNTIRQLAAAIPNDANSQQGDAWRRVDEQFGKERQGSEFSNSELNGMSDSVKMKDALRNLLAEDPEFQAFKQQAALVKLDQAFVQLESEVGKQFSVSDRQLMVDRARKMQATDLRYVYFTMNNELEQQLAAKKVVYDAASQSGQRSDTSIEPVEAEVMLSFKEAAAAAAKEVNLADIL